MAQINGNSDLFRTPVLRYYIDIRPHAPINPEKHLKSTAASRAIELLPLIHTLPQERQETIKKYVRKPDRYMSLSSELLKFYFIHKNARIPWSEVKIIRTPKPHNRPYWAPPEGWRRKGFEGLEFNVSHQAGMIVLVGCRTPNRSRDVRTSDRANFGAQGPAVLNPDPTAVIEAENEISEDEAEDVRVGVDVACTWEPPRTQDLSTQAKFDEWVDIFGEMFSESEQENMKHSCVRGADDMNELVAKTRRFYTYWALKEAYIKMVGEGLLASWLRELEFENVPVTLPCRTVNGSDTEKWTRLNDEAVRQMKVLFKKKSIEHTMQTSLESFEDTFVVATMTRGVLDEKGGHAEWQRLDFSDIEACATGRCQCL